MNKMINGLWLDNIKIIIGKNDNGYFVDVRYISDDGEFEDGEYLDGYTGLSNQEDAEFLARVWIAGYKLAKRRAE